MNLSEYPAALAEIEYEIQDLNEKIREQIYKRDRKDSEIDLQAAGLSKEDYPNADARKAWAASERRGEDYMTTQRQLDMLNDAKAKAEIRHREIRRGWKVTQIVEQKRLRAMAFWNDDTRPEEPGVVNPDEPEETPEETPAAFEESRNRSPILEPDDDLPF